MVTTRAKQRLVCGHMSGVQSPFLSLLTTPGSNTLEKNMPPPENGAKILYVLIQKGRGKICKLTIKWDYVGKKVHLSMPSYVEKALKCFQHSLPIVPQDQLHQHIKKMYNAKVQQANPLNTSPPLVKAGKKFIHEVRGVLLYLAQAVDSTMLTALSSLASKQVAPTEKTMQKCQ
jgi:hypothetical protein